MHHSLAILAALACLVSAQNVISFYYPGGYDGDQPVATIETANPSTTQFRIACPTGSDESECGFGPGVEYTILSSTRYEAVLSGGSFSASYGCDYNSQATEMTCTVNHQGGGDGLPIGRQVAILRGTDVVFNTASIVEGASLLKGAGHTTATASAKNVPASASSGATPAGTHSSSAGASKTGESPSSAKATGAAARSGAEGATVLSAVGALAMLFL